MEKQALVDFARRGYLNTDIQLHTRRGCRVLFQILRAGVVRFEYWISEYFAVAHNDVHRLGSNRQYRGHPFSHLCIEADRQKDGFLF